MKTKDNPYLKRKKRSNQIKALIFLVLFVAGIISGWYWSAIGFGLLFYVLHQILWSDHIFYDPHSDYTYPLAKATRTSVKVEQSHLRIAADQNTDTLLLALQINASWFGRWLDPYVEISGDGISYRQYFERGVRGLRYLNLSEFAGADVKNCELKLVFHHCRGADSGELLAFNNPDFTRKRTLIISPHADDAELAAFGLYSAMDDVNIVTLSAGEIEEEAFLLVYPDKAQASRLKGRLRALDSLAAPMWGGVSPERVVHLGYFCMQLPGMLEQPEETIPSRTAELDDVRLFRQFNNFSLPTDDDGRNSGENLLQDLRFLIDKIKPEVIITPHPTLDPHPDHQAATQALQKACQQLDFNPEYILFYGNHFATTDMHPFGPEHSAASLPPNFDKRVLADAVYSFTLSDEKQRDKIFALEMMHDLKPGLSLKKRTRKELQRLVGRVPCPYGEDAYFQKAVKRHELLIVGSLEEL